MSESKSIIIKGARVNNLKTLMSKYRATSWLSLPDCPVRENRRWHSTHCMPKANAATWRASAAMHASFWGE